MNLYDNALAHWKATVKHLLNTELEFYVGDWNIPTFKINDIEMTITQDQFEQMFTINLPNYYDYGETLVRQYNRLKHIQDMIELSDAGIGCA